MKPDYPNCCEIALPWAKMYYSHRRIIQAKPRLAIMRDRRARMPADILHLLALNPRILLLANLRYTVCSKA